MISKIIYSIAFLLFLGCTLNASSLKHSKLIDDFFKNPTSEQVRLFKKYSLDEQYDIFLFGNQVVHPPAIYLARPFAEQGPTIVPFLKAKLESTQNDVTIRDIVMVFSELAELKLYSFSYDSALLVLIDKKVNDMKGIWKETTLKMVSEIRPEE